MTKRVTKSPVTTQDAWALYARGLVRAEMARLGITYAELARRLKALGIDDDPQLLNNRIARGTFSALLLCQIMRALDVPRLDFRWEEFETKTNPPE